MIVVSLCMFIGVYDLQANRRSHYEDRFPTFTISQGKVDHFSDHLYEYMKAENQYIYILVNFELEHLLAFIIYL